MLRVLILLMVLKFVQSNYETRNGKSSFSRHQSMSYENSVMISQGGGAPELPPIFRPDSQAYAVSNQKPSKSLHEFWEEETKAEKQNCLLCEKVDSGNCRSMPSCIYCEPTVTALCDRSAPCLRCTVIKNPFFQCTPGEKYMDECDSCRCLDGRSGWCTNMFCEFRPLYLYAMRLSDGELY